MNYTRCLGSALMVTCIVGLRMLPDTIYWTVYLAALVLIAVGSYGVLVAISGRWVP